MTCQEVTFLILLSLKISRVISKEVLVLACTPSKEISIIIFKIPCIYFKAGSSRHFVLVKDLEACLGIAGVIQHTYSMLVFERRMPVEEQDSV